MDIDQAQLATFRRRVSAVRSADEVAWESSRHLISPAEFPATLNCLAQAIRSAAIPEDIKPKLLNALPDQQDHKMSAACAEALKQLTGLPPSKALRALCVFFEIRSTRTPKWPAPNMSPAAVEAFLGTHRNPFDLLLEVIPSSLLELGAGDLSFAEEVVRHYATGLLPQDHPLILHCLDRLNPDSQLGGPLHANPLRLQRLRVHPGVQFAFHGNQDMFALQSLDQGERIAARYAIVACWAPATPTFAYEPTRLSPSTINEELRRTKGMSRHIRHERESALEVIHDGRSLIFPPWKFEICGPLALLELMADRGALCVLGAIDSQVFWEILSQLIEDPTVRPSDVVFTPDALPTIFGETYRRLSELAEGETCILSKVTPLRRQLPRVLNTSSKPAPPLRFRYVEIRRGALFEGIPSSSTAKKFRGMAEESSPWFLTMVPEPIAAP